MRGEPSSIASSGHWNNGYLFQYSNDGYYSVFKYVGGSSTALQSWTATSTVVSGDWNTLKVQMNGTSMSFWINDTLVWSGTDSSFSSGYAGLGFFGEQGGTCWADYAHLDTGSSLVESSSGPAAISTEQAAANSAANASPQGTVNSSQ